MDGEGQRIDARVRITPATWAERARLGQWHDLNVLAAEGTLDLALSPGNYRLTVSRGPEWSLAEIGLTMRSGTAIARQVQLEHEVALDGWLAADLHVHTTHSEDAREHGGVDGRALRAEGVMLAAVTDHNAIGKLDRAIDYVAGAELTSWGPEFGHFNAFPLAEIPAWRSTTPRRLFAAVRQNERTFIQINHPRLQHHIAYFELGGFDGHAFSEPGFDLGVDGIEIWNGYDLARPDEVDELLQDWRGLIASGHRLTATGGSDSHGRRGHYAGYPRTYAAVGSAEELAPALKAGRAFVTNGPLLALTVQGKSLGEEVRVARDGLVEVEVTLLAASWMQMDQLQIWADERLLAEVDLRLEARRGPLIVQRRLLLHPGKARGVHAVARGSAGLERLLGRGGVAPLAFTNPVYLGYDGFGPRAAQRRRAQ